MDVRVREFWERTLAEIDDGGFFGQRIDHDRAAAPARWTPSGSGNGAAGRGMPWPPTPVLFAHPDSWMTDVDAPVSAAAGLRLWRELIGPEFDRVVLLSLLPVVISMLLPMIVLVLLFMTQ